MTYATLCHLVNTQTHTHREGVNFWLAAELKRTVMPSDDCDSTAVTSTRLTVFSAGRSGDSSRRRFCGKYWGMRASMHVLEYGVAYPLTFVTSEPKLVNSSFPVGLSQKCPDQILDLTSKMHLIQFRPRPLSRPTWEAHKSLIGSPRREERRKEKGNVRGDDTIPTF